MIEIKCTKAQYKRIIINLTEYGHLTDGKCVLGKSIKSCPAFGKERTLSCSKCLQRNIKYKEATEN